MNATSASMALTIFASVLYHLCQKAIRPDLPPMFSLTVTYFVALVGTLLALLFSGDFSNLATHSRQLTWASFALGVPVILMEVGYLCVYRAGWNLGTAALFTNVAVTLVFIPIGFVCFRESLSWINGLGIVLSVVGLAMMGWKP